MSAAPSIARLRRLAARRGFQVTRGRDGRYVLHRWEARGELGFLLRVLEPPEHSSRPSWAGGR